MNRYFTLLLLTPLFAEESGKEKMLERPVVHGHVFAWPFTEVEKMQPRGGITQGTEVTLDEEPSKAWLALKEVKLSKQERDRRAILALAGSYRVSFDFVETMGFRKDYRPPRPYFSWGTEHVQVLENRPDFVSLQHTLVMYFKMPDQEEVETMTMKHWRQDWTYQDDLLYVYLGQRTWGRRAVEKVEGRWSQAVFQVDDSPRYEVMGRWNHQGGMHTWRSENTWRPLPRREFSSRDDYNVLSGVHEITLTRNGWVHLQNNKKLHLGENGKRHYVGQEIGVNRYERISAPNLLAAEDEWKKVGAYWAEVRQKWKEVYATRSQFTLRRQVAEKKLWQEHFGYAAEILKEGYDAQKGKQHACETIEKFLKAEGVSSEPEKY